MAQLYNPLRVLSKIQPLAGACGVATINASNLSPYRPFPAKGSVLTQMPQADAGAVRSSAGQNRWFVRPNIIRSTEGRNVR